MGGKKQADPSSRKSNILSNIDNSIFRSLRLTLSLCLLRGVCKGAVASVFWVLAEG